MECILLVGSESESRSMMASALTDQGYDIAEAADTEAASDVLDRSPLLDLVVLDLELERGSGYDLLAAIRRVSSIPVVVVSERTDEVDRVVGLRLGADDYISKPPAVRELVARVGAVLRRSRWARAAVASRALSVGALTIDLDRRSVTVRGSTVHTTHHEFEVLRRLARSPGEAVPRDLLLREVWRTGAPWGIDASLTEHVRRLRLKLEVDPHRPVLIETVRGVGYRLTDAVV
jgi:two-component system response regulator RegX3